MRELRRNGDRRLRKPTLSAVRHELCLCLVAAVRTGLVHDAVSFLQYERITEGGRPPAVLSAAARVVPVATALPATEFLTEFAAELTHELAIADVTFRVVVALP